MKKSARLKNILLSNLGLKITALVLSFLIWLFVVNVENPQTTQTYTTNVRITNGNVLTEQGKYYEVVGAQTVSFRVTAKRTIQQKLSNDDFVATADMNYLGDDNEIPISITARNYSSSVSISATPHYLRLKVGDLSTKQLTVNARTTGKPANGYVISDVTSDPETITVNGPKEIVSKIETVTATANVEGIVEDETVSAVPKFFDKDGKTIDTSELTLSADTVSLAVHVENSKTVPVTAGSVGALPEGLELDEISVSPSEITICGDGDTLNTISEITIDPSVVDLSQITDDWETTVDLTSYLPEGVTIEDGEETQAKISVTLKKDGSKTIEVPTANLSVQNLSDGLSASFSSGTVSVTVHGTKALLDALDASTVTGSADASGLSTGSHGVAVTLHLDSGLTADPASTDLVITEKSSGGSSGGGGSGGSSENSGGRSSE